MTRRSDDVLDGLVRDRYPALLARARMLLPDPGAQDLVQDALVAVLTGRSRPTTVPAAEQEVRRTLATKFMAGLRSRGRERTAVELLAAAARAQAPADVAPGLADEVEAALAALAPRERACVLLRHVDDLPVQETAEVLGLSEGVVEKSTSDAVRALCGLLGVRVPDPGPRAAAPEEPGPGRTDVPGRAVGEEPVVEGARDLTDLLVAAEAQCAAALAGPPSAPAASRACAAVRAARSRRRALLVGGAAAAVAVVAAVVVWSPWAGAPAVTDAAEPSGARVPGLSPLPRADGSDLRDAPEGSALALWVQPADPTGDATPGAAATVGHLLLVLPDGEVLDAGPAPEGAQLLTSWDRGAVTAGVLLEGAVESSVVDLTSGRVVGTRSDPFGAPVLSPDGTASAWQESDVHVERDGVEARHRTPATRCQLLGWADDTQVLLQCPVLDDAGNATVAPGATTVLMDTVTGAVTARRPVAADEPRPVHPAIRLDDGRLVAWMLPPEADTDVSAWACPARLAVVTGLDSAPFVDLPGNGLAYPGMVPVPGGLIASGTTSCEGAPGSPALWAVDAGTGEVTELLPSVEAADPTQAGLQSWLVGD